jgi:apolipoprotein N-acyltransferase
MIIQKKAQARRSGMTQTDRAASPAPGTALWLPLVLATVLIPFRVYQTVLPVAAWIVPVLLLRFTRQAPRTRTAWAGLTASLFLGDLIAFRDGYTKLPLAANAVIALSGALVQTLPYLADRRLSPRLRGIPRSLVLPLAMTVLYWSTSRFSPFGTWGVVAYSQAGNLPLLQILSITGLWGIVFLLFWLAPVVNEIWEHGLDLRAVKASALAFGSTLLAVLLFGGIRLAFFPPAGPTVQAAALATPQALYDAAFIGLKAGELARSPEDVRARRRPAFLAIWNDLLARSEQAAAGGARIIAWPESVPVLAEDEPALLDRARDLARRHGLYLLVTPWVSRRTDRFPFAENLAVLLDPAGRELWRYAKAHPVPGIEDSSFGPGRGAIPLARSPHGRLASVICFDADFPWLMRQAGQGGADLLLVPSDDWRAIEATHPQMAVFRAIENGASLLRPTSSGLTVAADYQGRQLGSVSTYRADRPLLVTALPARGTRTLYAWAGDWFAWLCLLGLVGIAYRSLSSTRS